MSSTTIRTLVGLGTAGACVAAAVAVVATTNGSADAGLTAAMASKPARPGWHVIHTEPVKNPVEFKDIAALGPRNVWVVGNPGGPAPGPALAEHWDGNSWKRTLLPQQFRKTGYLTSVAASSANDVWAVGGDQRDSYVLRWDGHKWAVIHDFGDGGSSDTTIVGTLPVGPKDVWAFVRSADRMGAWHFDGRTWKWVKAPFNLTSASALSAHDVWATGNAVDGNSPGGLKPQIAHWNGHTWRVVPTPTIASDTWAPNFNRILARSSRDVWVVGDRATVQNGQSFVANTPTAMHWDGHAWHRFDPRLNVGSLGGIASDGQGGIWAVGNPGAGLLHYSRGAWSLARPPVVSGRHPFVSAVSLVPHSTSLFVSAGVSLNPVASTGVILRYGP